MLPPVEATWVVPVFTVVGTLIGAAIAAIFGYLESRRRTMQDEKRDATALAEQRRLAMTARMSDYLASTYHGVSSMRDVALASLDQKLKVEKQDIWPTVDRVNSMLIAVKVNDPEDVIRAVEALDQAMVDLSRSARLKQWDMGDWRVERKRLVGDFPEQVIAVVRRHARELRRVGGQRTGQPIRLP